MEPNDLPQRFECKQYIRTPHNYLHSLQTVYTHTVFLQKKKQKQKTSDHYNEGALQTLGSWSEAPPTDWE